MTYKYHEDSGGVSKDSENIKWGGGIPIDYEVAKEIIADPKGFDKKFAVVEKTVKGEKIKVVEAKKEAKDVQQDSEQPK